MNSRNPHDNKQQHSQPKFMDEVTKCIEVLKSGGIILYPTDSTWSIGCDASNESAVKKVLDATIQDIDNITILVEHADRLGRHIRQIPDVAIQLIEVNDKPMTIVYPGAVNIAKNLLSADGSVGIRITGDEFCIKLISTLNRPIMSVPASVNSDEIPLTFRDVNDEIKKNADYIVKWRQNDPHLGHLPSVIKVGVRGEIEIIRQ